MIFSLDYATRFDVKGNMEAVCFIDFDDSNYNGQLIIKSPTLESCVLDSTAIVRSLVKEHYLGKKETWVPVSVYDFKGGRKIKLNSEWRK